MIPLDLWGAKDEEIPVALRAPSNAPSAALKPSTKTPNRTFVRISRPIASPASRRQVCADSRSRQHGVRAKFYRAVCDAHLTRIIQVDLKSEQFTYRIDDRALQQAQLMDGKLLLITNTQDLSPSDLVRRYKSLADIERGFRVLKSEIEIGPVYHRLPDRIRAHASICFMALILYRVMRQRLHAAVAQTSPEKALAQLRRIQHHRITLNGTQPNAGLSTTSKEQTQVLAALNLAKPSLPEQLTLL